MEVLLALCYILRVNWPLQSHSRSWGSRNVGRRFYQKSSCVEVLLEKLKPIFEKNPAADSVQYRGYVQFRIQEIERV